MLRQQVLLQEQSAALKEAYSESERLLQNTLPVSIAQRLKKGETTIADRFDSATVLFADIAGFSQIAAQSSPEELIHLLDSIFSDIDAIANTNSLEKIKTIGDCYMLVGGLFEPTGDDLPHHTIRVLQAALAIRHVITVVRQTMGLQIEVRIGIHVGPVIAGIIGKKRFAYDLWGDTVNIASRMESQGEAGKIHCTEDVYKTVKNMYSSVVIDHSVDNNMKSSTNQPMTNEPMTKDFYFEERGKIDIKGKGMMTTYFLQGQW